MVETVKARCTVLRTGKPGSDMADELRFDESKMTIRAGRSRMNLADVKRASDLRGKISVTSSSLSFIVNSTPETRGILASITASMGKCGPVVSGNNNVVKSGSACTRIGHEGSRRHDEALTACNMDNTINKRLPRSSSGGKIKEGAGNPKRPSSFPSSFSRSAPVPRKRGAFQPSNTLGLPSRKSGAMSGSARGKALANLAASSPGRRASRGARGDYLGRTARSFGQGGGGSGGSRASSVRNVQGHRGSGVLTRREVGGGYGQASRSGGTSGSVAGGDRKRSRDGERDFDEEVSDPDENKFTPPLPCVGGSESISRPAYGSGVGLWKRASATAMNDKEVPNSWTQALRFSSPSLPSESASNHRRGLLTQYAAHRETQWRREGFRNAGNTCYINSCLQGLLSLSGFTIDLRRKCWVQAMLQSPKETSDGDRGHGNGCTASSATSTATVTTRAIYTVEGVSPVDIGVDLAAAKEGGRQSGDEETAAFAEADASLYAALLRLAMQAQGSHGIMDASPLKSAIDRHSDRFAGNLQQDAHEFLIDLINTLHEETQPRLQVAAAAAAASAASVVGKPLRATVSASSQQDLSLDHHGSLVDENDPRMAVVDLSSEDDHNLLVLKGVKNDVMVMSGSNSSNIGYAGRGASVGVSECGERKERASERVVGDAGATGKVATVEQGGQADSSNERRSPSEQIMPTTRHFHAEVEVTLTCTRCAYSRRRKELYRDFSLDIPHLPEGEGENALDLSGLLDGFFKASELNLRCERCDNDQVRVEHSLAQLPGALILHMKRFKPVVSSPVASAVVDTAGPPGGVGIATPKQPSPGAHGSSSSSASTAVGVPVAAANTKGDSLSEVGSKFLVESEGGVSEQSGWTEIGMRGGGVSFVKLTTPVSIPKELDLERFCTNHTANAPDDELGEIMDCLDEQENPISRTKSGPTGVGHPGLLGGEKRKSNGDGVSVDLSLLEGWSDKTGGKRSRINDGTALHARVEQGDPFKFPPPILGGVLSDSTNSMCLETPGERRRRTLKDKENVNADAEDRWLKQDGLEEAHRKGWIGSSGSSSSSCPLVGSRIAKTSAAFDFGVETPAVADLVRKGRLLDGDGNIDYGRVLSFRSEAAGEKDRHARERWDSCRLPSVQSRPKEFGNSVQGGASMRGTMRDAEERRQVEAALSESREEALLFGSTQEEKDLAKALMLSQEDAGEAEAGVRNSRGSGTDNLCGGLWGKEKLREEFGAENGRRGNDNGKVVTLSSGAIEDLWECGACTLHNKKSSSACEVCASPKPRLAPWISCRVGTVDSPATATTGKQERKEDVIPPPTLPRKGSVRARYELRGVLHHLGRNAFAGHYVTDVREVPCGAGESEYRGGEEEDAKAEVGRWKRHDDSVVSPVSESTALNGPARQTAYICFYSLVK